MKAERERRGWSAATLASAIVDAALEGGEVITLTQQAVSHFENGKTKNVPRWVRWAEAAVADKKVEPPLARKVDEEADLLERLDLVSIHSVRMTYGMGGSFTDDPVKVDVMHFPRQWVESITQTPASMLTFARGRGNSMSPTIEDSDIVLIDRSDRRVDGQDAIWAFQIGDIAMMKRLRVRGENVTILSDNERVPPDKAHADEIHIVGRVTHIVRRL